MTERPEAGRPPTPQSSGSESAGSAAAQVKPLRLPRFRLGAVIALAAAAGLIIWVATSGGNGSKNPSSSSSAGNQPVSTQASNGPFGLSLAGLRAFAKKAGHPVYWSGPKAGYTYEVSQTGTANIFVRYLPPGAPVGDKQAKYLIIATYPFRNALGGLQQTARSEPGHSFIPRGGGFAWVSKTYPESVHMAFLGVNYQIEVYDPDPKVSRAIAQSGFVRPVS